ncbi:hypothetical protein CCACVL1_10297 [Corchorus capsularis]|uniref:KIB1-4 beta-propeller domain-containing protein n=1 Tax=Corchorus capsularis TaxID=210143 RepID=A0A1R3IRR6_COCAP|nr:hypothetical protein CCACVL1_10297 [Corchorus capsularis]
MAQKVKTKNKKKAHEGRLSQIEANINRSKTWPDLPQTLVDIIVRQPTLMQSISYGGLTKLCLSPPKKCYPNNSTSTPPFLQLLDEIKAKNDELNEVEPFLNVSFYRKWFWPCHYESWNKRPICSDWKRYVGYSNDAIVVKGATNPYWESSDHVHIYLWYLVEGYCHRQLPEWDKSIPLVRVVKSRSCPRYLSKQNCTVMVLTGISHPAFLFYRLSGEGTSWDQWVKQDCSLSEPHCSTKSEGKNFMTFTNAIGFNGKFYVLSLQGTLAVIDDTDSYPPRITALSSERAVPSVLAKHFREYLLESEGNVLLVFLISKNSIKIVDDVEVYQLNTTKLLWVRMASLGDRTLFLGSDCCMSVSASRIGCKSNSVYFSHQTADGWSVYDMEKGCISSGWTDATTKSPVWTEPIQEE